MPKIKSLGHEDVPLGTWLQQWADETPDTVVFELFQEPMGGPWSSGSSIFTTWTQKRGVEMSSAPGLRGLEADSQHFQSFAWIVDPVTRQKSNEQIWGVHMVYCGFQQGECCNWTKLLVQDLDLQWKMPRWMSYKLPCTWLSQEPMVIASWVCIQISFVWIITWTSGAICPAAWKSLVVVMCQTNPLFGRRRRCCSCGQPSRV